MFKWKNKKLEKGQVGQQVFSSNSLAYGVLFAALLAMTFFGVCQPNTGGLNLSGVAARVDGEKVSFQEFNMSFENTRARYQRIYQGAFDPSTLRSMVMNQLVEKYVLTNQARQSGVGVSDDEVDNQIIEYFKDDKGKFQADVYRRNAKANGMSEKEFYEIIRRDMLVQKYRQFVGDAAYLSTAGAKMEFQVKDTKINLSYLKLRPDSIKVSVTKADVDKFVADAESKKRIDKYYEDNKQAYNKEKQVKASHILIAYQGAQRASADQKRTKEDAKKLADKVLKEVKASGSNFAALAKKYTDEVSGKNKGGDLGFFKRDTMAKPFADAAFAMKKGQVSDVVETNFGFHVIKVTGIQAEDKKTVEQASAEIARKLIQDDRRPEILARRAGRILEELNKGSGAKTIRDYGYKWADTGDFGANTRSIPGLGSGDDFRAAAFKLSKKGQVHPEVIGHEGDRYIIRLKSRTNADLSKFDESKRLEVVRDNAFRNANTLYVALKDAYNNRLHSEGDIWQNQEYLTVASRENPGN